MPSEIMMDRIPWLDTHLWAFQLVNTWFIKWFSLQTSANKAGPKFIWYSLQTVAINPAQKFIGSSLQTAANKAVKNLLMGLG